MEQNTLEQNSLANLARSYINATDISVFLTGKAGTGKTTFLKDIVETTPKRCIVLAPTGVAAVNAGGQTIHSFFQLPLCPYLPDVKELVTEYQMPEAHRQLRKERVNIIRTLDLIIIDEISMVRADLLDAVDATLRRYRHNARPFGGVQLLMIGDVQQLPPVVKESERPYLEQVYASAFFFSAKVMQRLKYVTIELTHVYRQADAQFVDILNGIRDSRCTREMLRTLNSRLNPDFQPDDKSSRWIRLTTHNRQADQINDDRLAALKGRPKCYDCDIEGNFPESAYPADECLSLKLGAQVMFIRNDSRGGQYYNGKIGVVTELDEDYVAVRDSDDCEIMVERETWENTRYELEKESGDIRSVVDGKFKQFPLRLAWAVTVHKSQGLTFDHVMIDVSQAFTYGQVYVALSRCRTLEGIVLTSPIRESILFGMGHQVSDFCNSFPTERYIQDSLSAFESSYFFDTLFELFDMSGLAKLYGWVSGIFLKHLASTYPAQKRTLAGFHDCACQLEDTAAKFRAQLQRLQQTTGGDTADAHLHERINSAAGYFQPIIADMAASTAVVLSVSVDNKEVAKDIKEAGAQLMTELGRLLQCLTGIQKHGFSIRQCLDDRKQALLSPQWKPGGGRAGSYGADSAEGSDSVGGSGGAQRKQKVRIEDIYADNNHPELIQPLIDWRTEKYQSMNVPAFVVLTQKTLLGIAHVAPRTKKELLAVNGFGKAKWELYGQEILDLVSRVLGNG